MGRAESASIEHANWRELFDRLCIEQGHIDNMKLAERYCSLSGNTSQAAFDAALKNLRNWRIGANVPQRRNFLLLTRLLGVAGDRTLKVRWDELYLEARSSRTANQCADGVEERSPRPLARAVAVASAVAVGLGAVTIAGLAAVAIDVLSGEDTGFEGIDAAYVRNITAKVGDSLIIHGARGECGEQPPAWEKVRRKLPELQVGALTNGGLGTRYSRQCGGRTPARAILFTATDAGIETFSLYGDPITVRVQ